jgi:hypothetical protein
MAGLSQAKDANEIQRNLMKMAETLGMKEGEHEDSAIIHAM